MGIEFRNKINKTKNFMVGNSADDTNKSVVVAQIFTLKDRFELQELSAKSMEFFEETPKTDNEKEMVNKIKSEKFGELQKFNNELRLIKLEKGLVSIDDEKVTKDMLLQITSNYVLTELERIVDEMNNEKELEKSAKN